MPSKSWSLRSVKRPESEIRMDKKITAPVKSISSRPASSLQEKKSSKPTSCQKMGSECPALCLKRDRGATDTWSREILTRHNTGKCLGINHLTIRGEDSPFFDGLDCHGCFLCFF
jgi:hypothetical protein